VRNPDFGVTEANRIFVRYGWKVTVKNGIPRPQIFDVVVQFLNARGLVIDTARLYQQGIAGQDEQTIQGDKLISQPGAQQVASISIVAIRQAER
jgi:hypothetical protein